ncbi:MULTISPECIES: hypothetical protein [Streptomyces]|uniref:hypothetical protein n=1 Tax=Streptomyces TaxID=1883 RepID=UPI002248E1E0|nr:hypothetical protein [Streptomyces sp. JHD 1]MCX2968339.1 hypothetical protein [Streptomyces sp. JHD 1]
MSGRETRASGAVASEVVAPEGVASEVVASGAASSGAAGSGPAAPPTRRLPRRLPRRLRAAAAVALTVALLAAGGLLLAHARHLTAGDAAGNRALTDTAATDRVTVEVSDALHRVFSYGPDTLERTERDAETLLTGPAAADYAELFPRVEQEVGAQELTLTTHTVRAGVTELTADRARLLVFLDQTARRAGHEPTTTAAQLTVEAELRDGRWRITDLTPR